MNVLSLAPALLLAGCAATNPSVTPAGHPAAATAPAPAFHAEAAALPPAPQPDLPAPLRPDDQTPGGGMDGMDHGQMDHGQMDHGQMDHGQMDHGASPTELTAVLDTYLAIHDALASDRLDSVPAQAIAFGEALTALTAEPPADDPHRWHTHAADLAAIHTQARALTEAADLVAARTAFGALSVPLVRLVEATGVPEGYDITHMTCGMAPGVPEGGVWLQRSGATANPYFGSTMPTCGTAEGDMSGMDEPGGGQGHDGHTQ